MIINATNEHAEENACDTLTRKLSQACALATLMQAAGDEAISTDDVLWLLSDTLHDARLAAKAVLYPEVTV